MNYIIENKNLKVTVNSFGAQICSVIYKGKEKSWQNQDGSWEDHAPVLFPVCGSCATIIDGVKYPLGFHGFAKDCEFEVLKIKKNYIELSTSSNEETKKVYPFDFTFKLIYSLSCDKINVKIIVYNNSQKDLYFSYGAHDSFVVDSALENYSLLFNKDENLIAELDDNGLLNGKTKTFPDKRKICIEGSGLKDDGSLIFKNLKSNKVWLIDNMGKKLVEVGFKGFHNFVFWRTKNNDMICIEPWLNLPDSINQDDVEFKDKNGVKTVAPNECCVVKRYIKYF